MGQVLTTVTLINILLSMFSNTKVICVPPAELKPVAVTGTGIRVSLFYLAPPIFHNGAINFKMCILQKE